MPKKILLADDSITIQKVIGLTFANEDVVLTVVDNGDEALIKARVNVHSFSDAEVQKQTDQGVEIAQKAYQAGVAALAERDVRRKGLGVSLIFIVLAISGLYWKIRQMESRHSP